MLCFFFFNDTATTEIYTLSLHDALPILLVEGLIRRFRYLDETIAVVLALVAVKLLIEDVYKIGPEASLAMVAVAFAIDRKSTRLNSSHANISYAVFCLKKKK